MQEKFLQSIHSDLEKFNIGLIEITKTSVSDFEEVLNYIFSSKGKQIRPIFGMLIAKNLNNNITDEQMKFLQSIELIHNATIFHDDVIDEANIRHSMKTLNAQFSNKIAILVGDYFLSLAIQNIYSLQNNSINELLSTYMKDICEGEIEQNYSLNKVISLETYIEKSRKKTALLFKLTSTGIAILAKVNSEIIEICKNAGENFGILFQLVDDYNNFEKQNDKPALNDLKSGVITAPIIFLAQQDEEIKNLLKNKNYEKILKCLNNSNAMNETNNLISQFFEKTKLSFGLLEKNIYQEALIDLLTTFSI